MSVKNISELTLTNSIADNDLLVIDDGSRNYCIKWSTLKAALATVSSFTVNNTAGTITITLSTGVELTVTPHDPTKQDVLTFDSTPTQNSDNPVKSGGVFAALLTKLNSTDYVNFTGATDQAAGAAGKVPAPAAGGSRYLASTGNWETPDSTPTQNSAKLITSDAVYNALTAYLQKTGDGSDVTVAFTQASTRTNLSTGEKLSVLFGKVKKWFADLGTAAFRSATSSITQNSTDLVESGAVHTGLASKVDYSDISDEYDPTATYEVGDLCIHENGLYKCSTAISTAEAWTAAHWTAIALDEVMLKTSDVVNNLNSTETTKVLSAAQGKALNDIITQSTYEAWSATGVTSGNIIIARYGKVRIMSFEDVVIPSGSNFSITTLPQADRPAFLTVGSMFAGSGGACASIWVRAYGTFGSSGAIGHTINGELVWFTD